MDRYSPKLKPYLKKLDHSYAFGLYPTLDLIKIRPDLALKVLLSESCPETDMIDEISAICTDNGIPLEKSDKIIQKLAYKKNTYAIGVFQKYYPVLSEEGNHVVLVEPRNMGNIGTVVRTMVGFGIKDLALVRPAADIFDPKVIRSAMGSLFRINFEYFDTFEDYYLKHMNHSMYPFIVHGGRKIKQIAVEKPFSLIFGNESRGLDRTYTTVGQPVYIPQTNEVDSLNLSIAAGIAMWYFASITGY